jgi:tetratricopeptide (TPR) repeat protein
MRSSSPIPLFLLWCLLVWIAPSSVFWRDSGEFIVQAFALDISHPAGFPTYAQIANVLSLVPFGPIAWRVILVSSASLIVMLISTFSVINQLNKNRDALPIQKVIAALLMIAMLPLTIKQAQSAEVYLLNGAFLLSISALMLKGIRLGDKRFLMTAALLGGLALGNHISAALSGLLLSFVMLLISPLFRRSAPLLSLFFLLGMSVYCYLPARSANSLPMNTGMPNTATRLWRVLSDARDRELRPAATENESTPSTLGYEKLINNPLDNIENDLKKIGLFNSLTLATLLAIATIICLAHSPVVTLIIISIGSGNYLFFSGWDGDPWVVAVAAISVIFIFSFNIICEKLLAPHPKAQSRLAYIIVFLIIWRGDFLAITAQALELRNYQTPSEYTQHWLSSSSAPVIVSENSWFLARYLSDIEGVADNRLIVYQPSLLFPNYFNPVNVTLSNADKFTSLDGGINTFGLFIEKLAQRESLLLEPSIAINQLISPIAVLQKSGATEIKRDTYAETSVLLEQSEILEQIKILSDESVTTKSFIRADAANFRDNVLLAHINLWQTQGRESQALEFIDSLCKDINSKRCSISVLNQRGLLLLKLKKFTEAAEYFIRLIKVFPDAQSMLSKNLALAEQQREAASTQAAETIF